MKKNNRTVTRFFVLFFIMSMSACAPIYTPNVIHAPLFSEQHDADVQIGMGTCGYDAQVAYAPTNFLGVMVNSSFKNKDVSDTNYYHKHSFIEAGVGYFGKINEAGRYECYVGYGNGSAQNYNDFFYGYVHGNYNRFFIQPSIGAKTDVFDGAFSLRVVYVDMYKISRDIGYNRSQLSLFYFEPVITARVGYKFVKFFAQAGFSIPVENDVKYTDSPFILNIGMNFSFSKSYLKNKNQTSVSLN